MPGLYAAGWAARGPVGVIASTMHDAYALSDIILQDHFAPSASPKHPEDGLPDALARGIREGQVVQLDGWQKIDEAERRRAKDRGSGKEREKFTKVEDMLAVLS
jgi:adrenodoxin-NADP+ reductase